MPWVERTRLGRYYSLCGVHIHRPLSAFSAAVIFSSRFLQGNLRLWKRENQVMPAEPKNATNTWNSSPHLPIPSGAAGGVLILNSSSPSSALVDLMRGNPRMRSIGRSPPSELKAWKGDRGFRGRMRSSDLQALGTMAVNTRRVSRDTRLTVPKGRPFVPKGSSCSNGGSCHLGAEKLHNTRYRRGLRVR